MNVYDMLNHDTSPEPFKSHSRGLVSSIPRSSIQPPRSAAISTSPQYQTTAHSHFPYASKYSLNVITQSSNATNGDKDSPRSSFHSIILNQPVYENPRPFTSPNTYTYSVHGQNTTPIKTYDTHTPERQRNSSCSFSPENLHKHDSYSRAELGPRTSSLAALATAATSRDRVDQEMMQDCRLQPKEPESLVYSWGSHSYSRDCEHNERSQHRDSSKDEYRSVYSRGNANTNDTYSPGPYSSKDPVAPLQSMPQSPEQMIQQRPAIPENTEIHSPTTACAPQSDGTQGSPLVSPTSSPTNTSLNLAEKDSKGERLHTCSYTENCETKSPLRKVVSHFFGRNKLATRKIPKHLWVYFCRKHYQRSRYRNPKGFASLQIELVMSQIENLKKWGGVQDWTVKVRRREEIRQIKFSIHDQEDEDADAEEMEDGCDEEALEDNGEQSRRSSSATSSSRRRYSSIAGGVPEQYLDYVGDHKSMDEVISLVEKIRDDMDSNGGTFPDLELLPNVAEDIVDEVGEAEEENDKPKGKKSKGKPKTPNSRKRRATEENTITTLTSIKTTRNGSAKGEEAEKSTAHRSESHESHEELYSPTNKRKLSLEHHSSSALTQHDSATHAEMVSAANTVADDTDNHNKRRRVHALETPYNQQTITPPPSAPGGSRRTSYQEIDIGRDSNDTASRRVDGTLHNALQTSLNSFEGRRSSWKPYQNSETMSKTTGSSMTRSCGAEEVSARLEGTRIGGPHDRPSEQAISLQLAAQCGCQGDVLDTITVGRL